MSRLSGAPLRTILLAAAGAGLLLMPASAADQGHVAPMFTPTPSGGWVPDRPIDDFLPVPGLPGPVLSDPKHPYVPNYGGQPTFRISDLTNPILKPWVIERMKKSNDEVLAGKTPYLARERCYPAGVPGYLVYSRTTEPLMFLQTKDKITMINEFNQEVRHIYLNVPHSKNPKLSWYGESVGRFEGNELVIDTIGLNDRTFVDNYRTPHSTRLHVVERFKLVEDGKILQATITVDDTDAFNMPWTAIQRWHRTDRVLGEKQCAESDSDPLGPLSIPQAEKPDF